MKGVVLFRKQKTFGRCFLFLSLFLIATALWYTEVSKDWSQASSLTEASRTSGGRKIGESKMVGHGLHETPKEVLFNGGKSSTESRSMIDCSLVAIKGTKWFGSQVLW